MCDPQGQASFDPQGYGRGPQGDATYQISNLFASSYIPNMKALSLPVSKKKNFEIFFLCSYVPNCDLQGRASFDPGGHLMNKLGRGPQGDAIYQI